MSTYTVQVVTPEGPVYEGTVRHLSARAPDGAFGILALHAPMACVLAPCPLVLDLEKEEQQIVFSISGGYLEFKDNHCTVLADTAEKVSEIDVDRATASLERGLQHLKDLPYDATDEATEAAVARARNRIKVAKKTP